MCEDIHAIKDAADPHDAIDKSKETSNASTAGKTGTEKGSKKKKGKSTGNTKMEMAETDPDYQESAPSKSKKSQKKGKASSLQGSDSKPGPRKDTDRMQEESLSVISEEWLIQKIVSLTPDFEEQGEFTTTGLSSSMWQRSVLNLILIHNMTQICRSS